MARDRGTFRRLLTAATALALLVAGGPARAADSGEKVVVIAAAYGLSGGVDPTTGTHSDVVSYGGGEVLLDPRPDGTIANGMTESYERTDKNTWTFTLREGMTFHNGNTVDAEAVIAAIERVRESVQSVSTTLEGAEIAATDALVFTITTPEPNAYIPSVLGSPLRIPIFDVAAFDEAGEDVDAQIAAGLYTGPYQVVSLDTQRMVLEAYPDYWGGPPPFDRVEVVAIEDPQAKIAAVQSGEVNIALGPPPDAAAILKGDERAVYRQLDLANGSGFVRLNTAGPLADRDVRRAITLAVDYALTDDVTSGEFQPATSFYQPGLSYAVDTQTTDVDEARALLDGAGWEMGADGVRTRDGERLELTYFYSSDTPSEELLALMLQDQLAAVGIALDLNVVEDTGADVPPGWGMKTHSLATEGTSNDPANVLRRWFLEDPSGPVEDPELEALVDQLVAGEGDADQLLAAVQERIGPDQAYAFVMGHRNFSVVTDPNFTDYVPRSRLVYVSVDTPSAG